MLGATPVLILARRNGDAPRVLGARAAGTVEVEEGIRRTMEAGPSRFGAAIDGTEPLKTLTSIVVCSIEGARRSPQLSLDARRRGRRVVPRERRIIVTTHDGRRLRATIADVSTSGLALTEALPRLETGQTVIVGCTWACNARTWQEGIAFEFEAELDPLTFGEGVLL